MNISEVPDLKHIQKTAVRDAGSRLGCETQRKTKCSGKTQEKKNKSRGRASGMTGPNKAMTETRTQTNRETFLGTRGVTQEPMQGTCQHWL